MPYDEGLAERIRDHFEGRRDTSEKKMFGGLCVLINGNMCCGIVKDELMLRVGPEGYEDALAQPHAREMDFTGRALKGMIYVGHEGFAEDEDLTAWLDRAEAFAKSLPKKGAKEKAAARKNEAAVRKKGAPKKK
ncbi:MAG: TfoX/Sxy family protein [Deltaproteobacteria bacterium]|jgi:TfoX/Sxy family transcriptional regulator of competence genes|nr:TfoX/Sxy family protein [Deltaproteobacteria bacterium]